VRIYDANDELTSIAALAWPVKGVGFLSAVVTDPKKRRQGYGGRAIHELIKRGLATKGEVTLLVGTDQTNAAAVRRYEANGMSKRLMMSARHR
jgi:predicted GNAT family acetyltransferase